MMSSSKQGRSPSAAPLRFREAAPLVMGATADFRFYAELNDFLPAGRRQRTFAYPFTGPQSVKHLIEAAGIPHTEVEAILANGAPVDFTYMVGRGDRIAVYPPFNSLRPSPTVRLRPPRPRPARFLLDVHLGRLARYLRLLGFDARYAQGEKEDDADLATLAAESGRILLSRDRELLMRKVVVHGCCLRTREPRAQLSAVLRRYGLYEEISGFSRCLNCSGLLEPVDKAEIVDQLEPKTKQYYDDFQRCRTCGQIYWQGSHFDKLAAFLADVRREAAAYHQLANS